MQTLIRTSYSIQMNTGGYLGDFDSLSEIKTLLKKHWAPEGATLRIVKRTWYWNSETHVVNASQTYIDSF